MSHETFVKSFVDEIHAIPGGEHLEMCFSCGTCVSKCLIQQKLEPEYNPRRLLRLAMMDAREEAFTSPTTWLCSACDLCYSACPQQIHISSVIGVIKQLAVETGHNSPLESVKVDEKSCSGCGICVMACPYEAPHLVEKKIKGVEDRVAEVDANRCMRCGTCVAACPLGAISRKGMANSDFSKQLKPQERKTRPSLIAFVCDWSLRADDDMNLLENYPANIKVIHIPCSGRIDPQMALLAINSGVDGVLVCGCNPGECHFKRGNYVAQCKLGLMDMAFEQMNVSQNRIRFVQIGTQDRGRIKQEIETMLLSLEFTKEVAA
jgi:heterodisulfide reductase subunit C2